jgi:ATP-dependent exoDNAse (exonuclease V) alpha subunit
MAIFHLNRQVIKRSKDRSTVACASYRSGEELHDELRGKTFKFKRQDRVRDAYIIAPANAQPWAKDRTQLWNGLEAVERRKDAQLATELTVALPNELPTRVQKEILAGFIHEHYTSKGFIADVAIHHSPIGKPDNDHAHIMTPLRAIDPDTGEWRKTKDRAESRTAFADNRDADIEALRASWASHVNSILKREDIADRIDHRSHKDRGITNVEPGIHVGYVHQAIEERGGRSWRADLNRQIRQTNQRILAEIKARAVAWLGLDRTPAAQTPAPEKQEPAQAPIAAKPEPIKPPMPPPTIPDVEAEKRKKAALRAAWLQQGGGGGVGG